MNIYFLVEGRQTERKIYPAWLSYLIPDLDKVQWYHEVKKNQYCLFSGDGFPSLLDNHLRNTIEDVNEAGNFDYLVLCLDADDLTIEEAKEEVLNFIEEEELELIDTTELVIIVQRKCLESWLLGNTTFFKRNPENPKLLDYYEFYNVRKQDPEEMLKPKEFINSVSVFHFDYLYKLFKERNLTYSKRNPKEAMEETYLQELIKRNEETGHLDSFKSFLDFCQSVNKAIA